MRSALLNNYIVIPNESIATGRVKLWRSELLKIYEHVSKYNVA